MPAIPKEFPSGKILSYKLRSVGEAGYERVVDPKEVSIDCYDTSGSLGKGYPYREDSDEVILNLKTRKISYNYEDNDDLARWLEENDL